MLQPKHPENEKKLCQEQNNFINGHCSTCPQCKKSKEEYDKFKISTTPTCKRFISQLKDHIDSCEICNKVNKKWNEDAIPITPEMRKIVYSLSKGKIPDPHDLAVTRTYLMEKLQLSSNEIKDVSTKIESIINKMLGKQNN